MEALSRKLEFDKKGQMVFTFGDNWSLSVINKGYGASEGLFEIAPMVGGGFFLAILVNFMLL